MPPKVSIITPIFNGRRFFHETIESVNRQTYTNWEHIIIDDGSTDGAFDALKDNEKRRTWYFNEKNIGEVNSVNRGYSLAIGKYVLILNSDDTIDSELLQESIKVLEQNAGLYATYPDWRIIDENSQQLLEIMTKDFNPRLMFEDFVCIPGPGVLFLNSTNKQLRDPSFKWASDYDHWLRISDGQNLKRIPKVLASWRQHDGAQTQQRSLDMAKERIFLIKNAFSRENSKDYSKRRALGAAYFMAARLAFFDSRIPSIRWTLKSFYYRPLTGGQSSLRRPLIICGLLIFPPLLTILRRLILGNHQLFSNLLILFRKNPNLIRESFRNLQ